jgi:hypothetical protein
LVGGIVRRIAPWIAAGGAFAVVASLARSSAADPMSTSPERAYDLGEIPSPRAVGMGGALNALGVSTASIYLNPANMALARVYHLEGVAAYSPEARRQTYALAIVDSLVSSTRLAGGLAGAWSELDPDGLHRTWTDVRGGLALPFGDHLAIGAALRWLRMEQAVAAGPFGASRASGGTPGGPIFNGVTFDAGATVSLGDFRIAIDGHNLTFPKTALAPATGAAGIGFYSQVFAVEVDGLLDFTTWEKTRGRVMAGGELFLADRYAVRVGWRYDAGTELNTASLGFGYIDPKWSAEAAVARDVIGNHGETLGIVSLRYFYDPTGATQTANDPGAF